MKQRILIISLLFIYGCNGCRGPENYKTAYLKKTSQKFTITLRGKGALHPASPFDIGKTYEDSMQYLIPIDSGIIKAEDLPYDSCCYPKFGTIEISGSKLKINIYFNDTDTKKIDTFLWNGDYELLRIN